ncbi:hypothetical protein C8A03DRAFT_47288 [Achaetomium macrosporum]|uniref:Uncharacterized protein n=1 Tax=Achaetomium macrosporum TaxID=79813 RepID=A0AAN7H4E2_9PEZI|nr:hypothetical protein C8A03DRAFT_47288 [Achaetomium macrosporum]
MSSASPTTTVDLIDYTRDSLKRSYNLKELGKVKRFLGFDVICNREARKVFPAKFKLPAIWEPLIDQQKTYMKDTGATNWISCSTRPDIAYTVSRLAKANAGPSQAHLNLIKHLLQYLKGTPDYSLEFGSRDLSITDLGHAVFTFIALSTTEAEFANLAPAALSTKWIARILEECGALQLKPTIIFTNSLNAHLTVINPINKARTRTIDIRYKWIIEQPTGDLLEVRHIKGVDMPAETKPLQKEKHAVFMRLLGMVARKVPWA